MPALPDDVRRRLRAVYDRSPKLQAGWRRLHGYRPSEQYVPVDQAWYSIADLPLAHDAGRFELSLWINHSFKWPAGQLAFASVFSGSNDRGNVGRMEVIERDLAAVARRHPTTLLTVVGGMFFLDLVARVEFARVVLFDQNVAELAKGLAVLDRLDRSDGTEDAVLEVEQLLREHPEVLLPQLGSGAFGLDLGPDATWEHFGRTAPALPIFPSDRYPEYAWKADADERKVVVDRLRRSLVRRAFPGLPYLDAGGHLVVVFASNISAESVRGGDPYFFADEAIRRCIRNAAGVLIVRSYDTNARLDDPHPYWEAVARSVLRGSSHQVWSAEDGRAIGTFVDRTTTTSSCLDDASPSATAAALPAGTETVLLHLLVSKAGAPDARKAAATQFLRALPDHVRRVVVAEMHPNEANRAAGRAAFASLDALVAFAESGLSAGGFQLVDRAFAPGDGDPERNAFLVFDR